MFKTGDYAKVWEITPISDTMTKLNISTSRKSKQSGEYEKDFSGFPVCVGTAAAGKASRLQKGDTIILGDIGVSNTRPRNDGKGYYVDYKIFSFELANGDDKGGKASAKTAAKPKKAAYVEENSVEDDSDLPY